METEKQFVNLFIHDTKFGRCGIVSNELNAYGFSNDAIIFMTVTDHIYQILN